MNKHSLIECACGCGKKLISTDKRNRPRNFIHGHNGRGMGNGRDLNRARIRANIWYYEHQQQLAAKRKANPEIYRERNRAYYCRNRHKEILRKTLRHSRRLGISGYHTENQWLAKITYYGWRCVYCKEQLDNKTVTKDHVIPLSKGGTDWPANLAPTCLTCNIKKGAKSVEEYLAYLRRVS